MPDGGTTLRSIHQSDRDIRHWHKALPLYAEVQIEISRHSHELLTLGVPDQRLAVLPALYEKLLADTEALCIDLPEGLTSDEYQRLREFTPPFAALCEQLASYRIPETLQHDDLHSSNVFVRDGHYFFFDWSDSCVAHPFFTMVCTLRSIAYHFELVDKAPELAQLIDLYLEQWTNYGSRENLLDAFKLAHRLGMVCRALTWYRIVSDLDAPFKKEHAESVPGWLQEFLNHPGDGGWAKAKASA